MRESYRGARIFQCIRLHDEVIDVAFNGTIATMGAVTFGDGATGSMLMHRKAFPEFD